MGSPVRFFSTDPPPRLKRRVLLVALLLSLLAHCGAIEVLGGRGDGPSKHQDPVEFEVVRTPPPEPPPPPVIQAPEAKKPELRKEIVRKEPKVKPPPEPPPPPNAPPTPQAPPSPIKIGASLESTTTAGGFKVGVGNTLYGKADEVAGDPSDAQGYAARNPTQAPYVPASRVQTLPKVLHEPPKVYPDDARKEGIEGKVVARIRIDETGKVTAVKVIEGPGHGLDAAARRMLLQFQFAPAMLDGRPVATEISYTYTFLLD